MCRQVKLRLEQRPRRLRRTLEIRRTARGRKYQHQPFLSACVTANAFAVSITVDITPAAHVPRPRPIGDRAPTNPTRPLHLCGWRPSGFTVDAQDNGAFWRLEDTRRLTLEARS